MKPRPADARGLVALLAGDGRPLLAATGLGLVLAGGFALFVAARGELLPHDVAYLGMTRGDLCAVNECRVVHFMVHDRVSFGGAITAVGLMYLWLVAGPLGRGAWWAWELLAASGVVGFLSFLAYLGYGYLDTWHGAATAALAPAFAGGLALNRRKVAWADEPGLLGPLPRDGQVRGRLVLLATAAGMFAGGATILVVGMTIVFVPEDVAYMGLGRGDLTAINPRLVPLIAHDRAGFGGAVCCCGVILAGVVRRAELDRAARQALGVAGVFGFGSAIAVHPAIGYDDWFHLSPAFGGAILYAGGLWLVSRRVTALPPTC